MATRPLNGRVLFLWTLQNFHGQTAADVAQHAHELGYAGLAVKAWDGTTGPSGWTQFAPFVAALHARGMIAAAWGYSYGASPEAEAGAALAAVKLGADALLLDCEAEYGGYNPLTMAVVGPPRAAQATAYGSTLRRALGASYPLYLTSFAAPDVAPRFPWLQFRAWATGVVPQCYANSYDAAQDPAAQIASARAAFSDWREVIPCPGLYGDATEAQMAQAVAATERDAWQIGYDMDSAGDAVLAAYAKGAVSPVAPAPKPTPKPTPSPTPAPEPTPAPTARKYTVRSGDTLSAIVQRFMEPPKTAVRIAAGVKRVTSVNHLADPNAVRVGEVLTIPAHLT